MKKLENIFEIIVRLFTMLLFSPFFAIGYAVSSAKEAFKIGKDSFISLFNR